MFWNKHPRRSSDTTSLAGTGQIFDAQFYHPRKCCHRCGQITSLGAQRPTGCSAGRKKRRKGKCLRTTGLLQQHSVLESSCSFFVAALIWTISIVDMGQLQIVEIACYYRWHLGVYFFIACFCQCQRVARADSDYSANSRPLATQRI